MHVVCLHDSYSVRMTRTLYGASTTPTAFACMYFLCQTKSLLTLPQSGLASMSQQHGLHT